MSYVYADEEKWLNSVAGIKAVGQVVNNANRLMQQSGCASMTFIWPSGAGDTFKMMAAVDRAVEMGFIAEIQQASKPAGQDRIFRLVGDR